MTVRTDDHRTQATSGTRPDPAPSGTGNAWLLVTKREVTVRATDRTFLAGTGVTLLIIVVLFGLQIWLANRTQDFTVVTSSPAATAVARDTAAKAASIDENVVLTTRTVADDAAARAAVLDKSADAWLHGDTSGWVLTTRSDFEPDLESVVSRVVRDRALAENAAAAGTTVGTLERGSVLTTGLLEGDAQRAELVGIVTFAFVFLFYLATLTFGATLASSVVEEKQSRIVEIIATAIPLRHLLAGKVIGNTLLAVAQLMLFVTVGVVGLSFTSYSPLVTAVSGAAAWFLVFFLAGFVALACLWAVAGSLASRVEDLQSTTTPLTMLVMGIFFAGLFLEGTWQTVGSFVPPLSAILMPVRLLQGDASWWEAVVALALLVATAALTVSVGERLYRRSLLQTGGRVSVRQAWRTQE
jgi:ABC-2 type transport system permease protein